MGFYIIHNPEVGSSNLPLATMIIKVLDIFLKPFFFLCKETSSGKH